MRRFRGRAITTLRRIIKGDGLQTRLIIIIKMGSAVSHLFNLAVVSIKIINVTIEHLSVTKKEPHDVQGWICSMNLGDHLVTHFLVATIEQLRKCRARDDTSVSKLRIRNPSVAKKLF